MEGAETGFSLGDERKVDTSNTTLQPLFQTDISRSKMHSEPYVIFEFQNLHPRRNAFDD